ncbi:MAG TPA: hypothetical protein PKC39_14925 [Ferruginibacter sp.]|nr:hypothetical protein [Ferruginibacter sp.]HMP22251.1 hypothetical protein [Ferruginibacter sp.]
MKQIIHFIAILFLLGLTASAQVAPALYSRDALKSNRLKLHQHFIKNTITKNLSLPLTDSTEENWMDALYAIQLTRYKSPWVDNCIGTAFNSIENRSADFQFALLELAYDFYPGIFITQAELLLSNSSIEKVKAICGSYIIRSKPTAKKTISDKIKATGQQATPSMYFLEQILHSIEKPCSTITPAIKDILLHHFFPGAKVIYSFQRSNRNYPGLAIIKDSSGNFLKDSSSGDFFWVPQLARSISNLPFYFTGGNTPQGIFRMDGFAVSKSNFIGPTENIQLTMPFETSVRHFLNDSSITDTVWTIQYYEKLLPQSWKSYSPVYETFYAGRIGRNEIIAHGTLVDPAYYRGQPYHPLTPTYGCLATTEIWNEETGYRSISDQQKLIDHLKKAGGANGYLVVIDIDDQQKPVSIEELRTLLQ